MSKIRNWATKKYVELQVAKEDGQGLAEYGLILALVAIACIGALQLLAGGLDDVFGRVVEAFQP